ncbi:MAG: hypothetical protein LBE49_05510 [Deltaproteobacteria bacterium]|nr:hypothetical protein [Deltaproteobacteria bacterium]
MSLKKARELNDRRRLCEASGEPWAKAAPEKGPILEEACRLWREKFFPAMSESTLSKLRIQFA